MGVLDELSEAIGSVAEQVAPSVVRIGGGWRGAAGIVVGENTILTNAHNVRRDELSLTFADGTTTTATLSGIDVDGDLAVLAAGTGTAQALEWADAPATIGTPVFAVAAGSDGARVTVGFVSGVARAFRGPRGRRISGSVEHTAPLAPGSSGSALVDAAGRLVGLNTNRLANGFYLALPADGSLRQRVEALRRGEALERPRLGVGIAPAFVARRLRRSVGLPERDGVLVRAVEDGSAAAAAGIREGDLIVEVGGRAIKEPDDVFDALGDRTPGEPVSVRLVRGADDIAVDVRFATGGSSQPLH